MKRIILLSMVTAFLVPVLLSFSWAQCEDPVHFVFTTTDESYPIVIDSAFLDCLELLECDEVGIFDDTGGGLLCVGASVYHPAALPIPLSAWKDDALTPQKDGYTAGHTMYFRVWSSAQNREESAVPHYEIGNGTFEFGIFSELWLEGPCVECQVDPDSLKFGTVPVGSDSDKTFTITNTGGGTLSGTVSEACADYSLVGSTTYSLTAGQSQTFTVRFSPTSAGFKTCTVETGNNVCVDVSCTGTGVSGPVTEVAHIPDTCVYQGLEACIPVYLDSLPPWEVSSSQMVLLYDESVLHATYATTEDGIAESWGPPTYNIGAGWIAIAMAGTTPLNGTGVLVWICFDVVGDIGDSTLLEFKDDQIILNDSIFVAKEGIIRVCPEEYEICGQVRYCLNDKAVDSVLMTISGGKSDTVYTDADGKYKFTHLPAGLDYLVRGDKEDDARDAISAFDASLVLRYVVGLLSLSPCQLIAGDVNGNCWVNAYDASLILKYVVGLISQFPVSKDWKFIPTAFALDSLNWCYAPDSVLYEDLSDDLCQEDWKGILYGDLSGNWDNIFFVGRDHQGDVLSKLPVKDIRVNPGKEFVVPIEMENLSEVYAAELSLTYDNSLLNVVKVASGELVQGYYFEKNLTPGEIRLATAGTSPIQGSGNLVYLTFKVLPQAPEGITTQLQVSRFCLNEASSGGSAFNISIGSGTTTRPMEFNLFQNYPNPFNPETEIGFVVPVACQVEINIYNVAGQLVKMYEGYYPAGTHSITWDGTNLKGQDVGSGIYFYRMEAGSFTQQKKMVLMR